MSYTYVFIHICLCSRKKSLWLDIYARKALLHEWCVNVSDAYAQVFVCVIDAIIAQSSWFMRPGTDVSIVKLQNIYSCAGLASVTLLMLVSANANKIKFEVGRNFVSHILSRALCRCCTLPILLVTFLSLCFSIAPLSPTTRMCRDAHYCTCIWILTCEINVIQLSYVTHQQPGYCRFKDHAAMCKSI